MATKAQIKAKHKTLLVMLRERYAKRKAAIQEEWRHSVKSLKEKHARLRKVANEWKARQLALEKAEHTRRLAAAKESLASLLRTAEGAKRGPKKGTSRPKA